MIRFALVEDDPAYQAQVKEYLKRYFSTLGEQHSLKTFQDGDEIVFGYRAEFDVILMDIQMGFMDGMTAAKEIRKLDAEVILIFITNMSQYAIEGYAVDALDYLLKPLSYYAFSQCIDRALTRIARRETRYLFVGSQRGGQKIACSQIISVEVQGHHLIYHTTKGDVNAVGTMKEVESSLIGGPFFRCSKCDLVNLDYVDEIRGDDAIVRGMRIPISRARKRVFLDALNRYVNEVHP